MLSDNDIMGDGQALSRSFADLLGCEELVENLVPMLLGNSAARIAYGNVDPFSIPDCFDVDCSLFFGLFLSWRSAIAWAALTMMFRKTWFMSFAKQKTLGRSESRSS